MKVVKPTTATAARGRGGFFFAALLAVILAVLFWRSFLPGYVHFSNDGPLGQQNVKWLQLPGAFTGSWDDISDIGINTGASSLSLTTLIRWTFGPVGVAKFYAPIALFVLGLGAWTFFRQLKLSPLAAILGALATVGAMAPRNLWHLLLDNSVHESTGGQATVSASVAFADVAAACGYRSCMDTDSVAELAPWLELSAGPHFARLLTRTGTPKDLPRPKVTPPQVRERFMRHIGSAGNA